MDMPNPLLAASAPRRLIIMNNLGHVEISWDTTADDDMRRIIQAKMDQGFVFYQIEVSGPNTDRVPLKTIDDLHRNQIFIDDEAINTMFADGKVALTRRGKAEKIMTARPARVKDAASAAQQSTIAVPPLAGG